MAANLVARGKGGGKHTNDGAEAEIREYFTRCQQHDRDQDGIHNQNLRGIWGAQRGHTVAQDKGKCATQTETTGNTGLGLFLEMRRTQWRSIWRLQAVAKD